MDARSRQAPGWAVLPYLIPCACCVLVSLLAQLVARRGERQQRRYYERDPAGVETICIVGSVLLFALVIFHFLPPILGYFLRVMHYSTGFLAFYAGRSATRSRKLLVIWPVAMIANMLVFSAIGGDSCILSPAPVFRSDTTLMQRRVTGGY